MKDFQKNANLALIVIDIQKSDFAEINNEDKAIPEMPEYSKKILANQTPTIILDNSSVSNGQ